MTSSKGSSRPRDRTHISYVSCIGRRILCHYGRLESPVQSAQLCPTQSCLTLGDPIDCSMPGFPVFPPTPRVDSNSCPLNQWCHPTISSFVSPFSSHLRFFPASGSFQMSQFFEVGGQSIRSFSFDISPSDESSGLISFRMDWLDLLAVQGTLKSLLQHHSSKASILQC